MSNIQSPSRTGKSPKRGYEQVQKARVGENRTIGFLTNSFDGADLVGFNLPTSHGCLIANFDSPTNQNLLRQSSAAGDDYTPAQITDASYFEFDAFSTTNGVSGGVRWEQFQQAI